ncbi:MAG TPA: hypothetical protein VEW03_12480, partial [Longimicrobiaceae bacterium]|nr:hypothetical protein [Longimicrobiaceae bacterium]
MRAFPGEKSMKVDWRRVADDGRARARVAWARLREAWGDRRERKVVIGLAVVSLASCSTGA